MSPLISLMKTGTPASDSCSASTWSVFVLPVPVRSRHEPVPVHHPQRHAHLRAGKGLVVVLRGAEGEAQPVEAVAGADRLLELLLICHAGEYRCADRCGRTRPGDTLRA